METIILILAGLLVISVAFNGGLGFKLYTFKKNRKDTYDARQLLHDLTVNAAVVEVRRIDPQSIFLRSPR